MVLQLVEIVRFMGFSFFSVISEPLGYVSYGLCMKLVVAHRVL